jgi:hypothetical protein
MTVPDPNAKAPRPAHVSSDDEPKTDMDHAPPAPRGEKPGFDRGTAQADRIARAGTLSGSDDSDQDRGGADRAAEARAGLGGDTEQGRETGDTAKRPDAAANDAAKDDSAASNGPGPAGGKTRPGGRP